MINKTQHTIDIIGAGLAGSEAALQLAQRGFAVRLFEMRPHNQTVVHRSGNCAELVCSNSLKSTKPDSAAGMLKQELESLGSQVLRCAYENRVAAGGALAVDREKFSQAVTDLIEKDPAITLVKAEVVGLTAQGAVLVIDDSIDEPYAPFGPAQAIIVASGPLTSESLAGFSRALPGKITWRSTTLLRLW